MYAMIVVVLDVTAVVIVMIQEEMACVYCALVLDMMKMAIFAFFAMGQEKTIVYIAMAKVIEIVKNAVGMVK